MASMIILSLLLYSVLFLSFSFFFKFLINDMIVVFMNSFMPDPSSFVADKSPFTSNTTSFMPDPTQAQLLALGHLTDDFALLLALLMAFLLAIFIVSNFSATATVLVSAMSYKDETLSFKDLCSRIVTTWKRALITGFYTKLHALGYLSLGMALAAPLFMSANLVTISAAIFLGISACVYCLYFPIVWNLAIVASIVDEGCGMESLGKAASLIKGKRLHGFMLNICFNLLVFIQFLGFGFGMILGDKGLMNWTIIGLFVMGFFSLGNFFSNVSYTVLYFQCKKSYGGEIESYGSMEYTKLPSSQPVNK
ncbi:hypothetical protein Adt_33977 [Abeliophyllum distichum]|uniref:Transmembrane protein n=1 Tax=Abeliophyllum distichum TaxID=126358 RepID=A0ABD1QXS2_9LAMI